jgi:hypothetical protein
MQLAVSVGGDSLVSSGKVRKGLNNFHFMMLMSISGFAFDLVSEGLWMGHGDPVPQPHTNIPTEQT